jgi:hypothetical protein
MARSNSAALNATLGKEMPEALQMKDFKWKMKYGKSRL